MNEFTNIISPQNINQFHNFKLKHDLCYLRQSIYEKILLNQEQEYFSLESFYKLKNIPKNDYNYFVDNITKELHKLGWKTEWRFGNTGIYIYLNDPPACVKYGEEF